MNVVAPHPGRRPEEFRFPFAEAARLIRACHDLADRARSAERGGGSAYDHARVDFAGQAAAAADRGAAQIGEQTSQLARRLDDQAAALEDAVTRARQMQAARDAAIAQWGIDLRNHHADVEAERATQRAGV